MANQPPSDGIRDLLTAHVGSSGWTLETGSLPDTPDKVIMISDTGGIEPNPKWALDFPSVQVMVRGAVGGYLAAFAEGKAVKDICLGIDAQILNDDRFDSITMAGDVTYIGRDENERPLFSLNFRLIVEPEVSVDSNRVAL